MKYRKKPVVIEAFRLGVDVLPEWGIDAIEDLRVKLYMKGRDVIGADVKTLEGTMHATLGTYIVKGVDGELYPCRADIFEKTYEEV